MRKVVSIFLVLACTFYACLGRGAWQARRDGIASKGARTQIEANEMVRARWGNQKGFATLDNHPSRIDALRLDRGRGRSLVELSGTYSTARSSRLNPVRLSDHPAHLRFVTRQRTSENAQMRGQDSKHYLRVVRDDSNIKLYANNLFWHSAWYLEPPHARNYQGAIAAIVQSRWKPDAASPRVLVLGLGGGVIAGSLLTHPRPLQNVCSVEFDRRVIDIARNEFFPVIFAGNCSTQEHKHKIIHGDAFDVLNLIQNERLGQFDFIVEDFTAFLHGGKAPASFWNSLHKILTHDGTLIVNTHFDREEDLDALKSELRTAGWRKIKQYVPSDLGLVEGMSQPHIDLLPRRLSSSEKWMPRRNIIVTARRVPRRRLTKYKWSA